MPRFVGWMLVVGAVLLSVALVGLIRTWVGGKLGERWPWIVEVLERAAMPTNVLGAGFALRTTLPLVSAQIPEWMRAPLFYALTANIVIAVTWLAIHVIKVLSDLLIKRMAPEGKPAAGSRRVRTRIMLMQRLTTAAGIGVGVVLVLMSFPWFRSLGTGLLASAGVAGILIGVAAKELVGNVLAGLQIAFGDTLHVDDAVTVEGEYGLVEELTLTYVVVRTPDHRRLILPVSYFITHPFVDWSRRSELVNARVVFFLGWDVPVQELRTELGRILVGHPLWAGGCAKLIVVKCMENGLLKLRASMDAPNACDAFDLEADVRERLMDFLRVHHPQAIVYAG